MIADSEVISLATLRDTLIEFGIELSDEDVRRQFLGCSLRTITAFVSGQGRQGDAADFPDRWQDTLFERFRRDLKPVPGISALLDRLTGAGVRYCIASSGTFERIGVALSAMEMSERFADVFSAEQVAHGKPAPDLFLHAADQMDVVPDRCLVIEDSPLGVRAARTAGMRCMGFTGGTHLQTIADDHGQILRRNGAELLLGSFDGLLPLERAERHDSL